jgi:hypothetical protein
MENKNSTSKSAESQEQSAGIISEGDVSRIARAISDGIKQSKIEKPNKAKQIKLIAVVVVLFIFAAGVTVWFFKDRPWQPANFQGPLDINTVLTVESAQRNLVQMFRETTITGLRLGGHDQPIELILPMNRDQQAALALAIETKYEAGSPIEKDGPIFDFNFSQPTKVNIDVGKSGYISLKRSNSEGGKATVQVNIRTAQSGAGVGTGPTVGINIVPASTAGTVRIITSGKDIGEFKLQPGLYDEDATAVLKLRSYPQGKDIGELVGLNFDSPEPDFQTLIEAAPEVNGAIHAQIQESIEIKDSPDSNLKLGTSILKMNTGQSWRLSLSRPQEIKILANKITFNTANAACVTSLVDEGNAELLLLRYNLIPEWQKQVWQWGVFTLSAGTLMSVLRYFKIIPS